MTILSRPMRCARSIACASAAGSTTDRDIDVVRLRQGQADATRLETDEEGGRGALLNRLMTAVRLRVVPSRYSVVIPASVRWSWTSLRKVVNWTEDERPVSFRMQLAGVAR